MKYNAMCVNTLDSKISKTKILTMATCMRYYIWSSGSQLFVSKTHLKELAVRDLKFTSFQRDIDMNTFFLEVYYVQSLLATVQIHKFFSQNEVPIHNFL